MSISNQSNVSQLLSDIDFVNSNAANFKKLSQQLSTGRRHAQLRDYGTLVSKVINLQSVVSSHESYLRAIELVDFNVKAFQNSLDEIEFISRQAFKAAGEAAPNSADASAVASWRSTMGNTADLLLRQLDAVMNSQIAGKYVFSGNRFEQPAVKDLSTVPTVTLADIQDPRFSQFQTENNLPQGSVHFAAGETTKTIDVRIAPDTNPETFLETMKIQLTGVTFVTPIGSTVSSKITQSETIATVEDDDTQVSIENLGPSVMAEGGKVAFVVRRAGGSNAAALTVNLNRMDGSGVTAADYGTVEIDSGAGPVASTLFTGGTADSITIPAGEDSVTIWVQSSADTVADEGKESFALQLGASTGAAYTIDQNATVASSSINDTSNRKAHLKIALASTETLKEAEGNSGVPGTVNVREFVITRDNAALVSGTQTVKWSIDFDNSQATALDFRGGPTSGEVTFAEGETSKTISVMVNADNLVEKDEMFQVKIEGADVAQSHAMAIIGNDEVAYSILPHDANKVEGGGHSFVVRRDGDLDAASAVDVTGRLISGLALGTQTVNFAAGESEVIVTFNSAGNAVLNDDDTIEVSLVTPVAPAGVGATINASQTTAQGKVIDDDVVPNGEVTIGTTAVRVVEGDNGLEKILSITVNRSAGVAREEYVSWGVAATNMRNSVDSKDFTRGHGVMPSYMTTDALGAKTEFSYIGGMTADDRDAQRWAKQSVSLRDGQSNTYGVAATDVAFQKLIKGLVLIKSAAEARNAGNESVMLNKSRNMLREATSDIRQLVAANAVSVNSIDSARKAHTSFGALAKNSLGKVRDVDAAEAAAKLTSLQSMVNASYSLIAKRAKLSLANFL